MPMQPKRLEFAVTRQCSGHCLICSDPGAPGANAPGGAAKLDAALAIRVLEDIASQYTPDTVVTLGGEPLLYADTVCAIQREAARQNVPTRRLVTNGYFTKSPERIAQVAQNLVDAGLTQILLTVDAFHQAEIPLETVRLFAEALLDAGFYDLQLHPAWYLSPEDDNHYNRETRRLLETFADTGIAVGEGYAVQSAEEASAEQGAPLGADTCGRVLRPVPAADAADALRLEPDGCVLACCRPLGQLTADKGVLPLLSDDAAEG